MKTDLEAMQDHEKGLLMYLSEKVANKTATNEHGIMISVPDAKLIIARLSKPTPDTSMEAARLMNINNSSKPQLP